jgi:hypothetical protein
MRERLGATARRTKRHSILVWGPRSLLVVIMSMAPALPLGPRTKLRKRALYPYSPLGRAPLSTRGGKRQRGVFKAKTVNSVDTMMMSFICSCRNKIVRATAQRRRKKWVYL